MLTNSRPSARLKIRSEDWNLATAAVFALLLVTFLCGGASRLHELRLAVVQLAALPLLVLSLRRLIDQPQAWPTKLALSILAVVVALPLFQLIPLPPAIWSAVPGRDSLVLALEVTGINQGWTPLSLTPTKTWSSFLALLPPVAMFLGIGLSPRSVHFRIVLAILIFTTISIGLGAAQLLSGGEQLYLWPTTGAGSVVGFFANRNHLATLVLVSLPFAAVVGARTLRRGRRDNIALGFAALFIVLSLVALVVIRSRMGLALAGPTLGLSLFVAWAASGQNRPKPLFVALGGAAVVAVAAFSIVVMGPVLARFDVEGAREGRFENWPTVASAANTYLPLGSGIGSFDAVYRSVEPLERLDSTFFNQAHNEYLELWLETGWMGAAALAMFIAWFARRSWRAWRGSASTELDLRRAASVAIFVILVHSAVDYPARTETIAVLLALFCALLDQAGLRDAPGKLRIPDAKSAGDRNSRVPSTR
jgi:O-antigen ligase